MRAFILKGHGTRAGCPIEKLQEARGVRSCFAVAASEMLPKLLLALSVVLCFCGLPSNGQKKKEVSELCSRLTECSQACLKTPCCQLIHLACCSGVALYASRAKPRSQSSLYCTSRSGQGLKCAHYLVHYKPARRV